MPQTKPNRFTKEQIAGWVRTGIYLPPELYAEVKAAAATDPDRTVSAFAARVFTEYFKRARKVRRDQ